MSSVIVKSVDRSCIQGAVRSYSERLKARHSEVEKIIWFGSWISGIPTPGSDVDLCLILSNSNLPMRERVSEYLPLGFPVGLDLFAYTREEFEALKDRSPGWYRVIVAGIEIGIDRGGES